MRFWELDVIKGIAIILVMVFHFVFDLAFFAQLPINLDSWLWWSIAHLAASLFIFVSGLVLMLGFQKSRITNTPFWPKLLARSAKLLGIGVLISLATWLFVGEGTIIFGILHFLAVAPLCAYFLLSRPLVACGTALCIFLSTGWVQTYAVSSSYFVWLGFQPEDFYSLDHFPLVPWLGIYLLGAFCASFFYPKASRRFSMQEAPRSCIVHALSFLGQHTLLLYLAHQPILLALLYPFMR